MSLRAVDARFVLPHPLRRAVVLGDHPGWLDGLRRGGVEIVDDARSADAVLAPPEHAQAAFAAGAACVLVLGGRRLRGAARIAALPDLAAPELLVPVGSAHAARHAVSRWRAGDGAGARLRSGAAARALAHGIALPGRPNVHVTATQPGPPLAVSLAADAAGLNGPQWYARFGVFANAHSRGAFFVFADGGGEPALVVKFSRVPGLERLFDEDEAGLRIASDTGGSVAAIAPRLVGRFDLGGGLVASAETAARGATLATALRSSEPRMRRLAAVDAIAGRLVAIARETRTRASWRSEELDAYAQQSLTSDERARLESLDAVFAHGDVHGENVLVDGGSFTLVDWESATATGPPLWDLLYFLASALAALDGVDSEDAREAHFASLFLGDIPSSETLFRWLRAGQAASSVPDDAVGPLATLLWSRLAALEVEHVRRVRETDAGGADAEPMQRRLRRWRDEPGLGTSWPARR